MAKESTTSRIPRLDGVSRIPLPGSIRPTVLSAAGGGGVGRQATQTTSIATIRPLAMQPPTTFASKRPNSLAVQRPSMNQNGGNPLKRSCSGDHIGNAVSLMTRKTTTVFKKLMNKTESKLNSQQQTLENLARNLNKETRLENQNQKAPPPQPSHLKVNETTTVTAVSMTTSTPRPLARSDTFVRSGDSPIDMLGMSRAILTQSTAAPTSVLGTGVGKSAICETTQLLSANTRHVLYTTQSLDSTRTVSATPLLLGETIMLEKEKPQFQSTVILENTRRTLGIGFDNTIDMSSPTNFGQTMNVNSPSEKLLQQQQNQQQQQQLSTTQTLSKPNLMKTFNNTQVLGRTMCVNSSPVEQLQKQSSDTILLSAKSTGNDTRIIDSADLLSPATNATYSNPGSMDNLIMLEDVSIPSGFDIDITLQPQMDLDKACNKSLLNPTECPMNNTLVAVAPDKTNMKLPLNSTMLNTENLVDLTQNMLSPANQMHMLNLTNDFIGTPSRDNDAKNNTQLLYMTQLPTSTTMTPDRNLKMGSSNISSGFTPVHLLSPLVLKGAQSDLVLPTRTPDEDLMGDTMQMDATLVAAMGARTDEFFAKGQKQQISGVAMSLQDVNEPNAKQKSRFSFGLDLTESTLDCSIELVDISLSSTALSQPNATTMLGNSLSLSHSSQQLQHQLLKKQSSFDLDESLGILTPDQMKEFLDSNTNNLDLPLNSNHSNNHNKLAMHQMRIDQTPSPEELPLDPVEVKTDISDIISAQHQQQQAAFCSMQQRQQNMQQQHLQSSSISTEPVSQHTDTELSKTDQMTKSNVSKISTSFITSVTSVTSLDTGYQGDGEMSRPASRGAGDHSPSNGPAVRKGGHVSRQPSFNQQQQQMQPIRRQDPMTDSDFFTESDADDIFHRGDRRAQVIDGQLYGPMHQPTASVFISEDPEDSCMESSGIFTDVENRCDEDLAQMRRQDTQDAIDMSPEGDGDCDDSTETVKSNRENKKCKHESENANVDASTMATTTTPAATVLGQGQLSCSQTSSIIQSSASTDRLSAATLSNRTSYCSVDGSTANVDCKSFSSLEEAFIECSQQITAGGDMINNVVGSMKRTKSSSSTATGNSVSEQQPQQQSTAPLSSTTVQRVNSARKHASLTSLTSCNTNGVYGAVSETNTPGNNNPQQTSAGIKSSRSTDGTITITTGECKISSTGDNSVKSVNGAGKFSSSTCANKTLTYHKINSPRYRSSPSSTNSNTSPPTPPTPAVVRKTHTPNKWDAVMNKIASNKVLIKKNYSDVKSKVSTRVNMSAGGANSVGGGGGSGVSKSSSYSSPIVRRSPSSVTNSTGPSRSPSITKVLHTNKATSSAATQPTDTGSGGVNGAIAGGVQKPMQAKRLVLQGVPAKRGRSYSKDSQKSSQSDLSLTVGSSAGGSGSPKLLAKTPLRAAKKRDVRNLSISPIDLGPPPKTQQTGNGTSSRPKPAAVTLTHKRFTSSVSSSPSPTATTASTPTSTTPTGINSNNNKIRSTNSPIVKKHLLGARRTDLSATTKTTPLKDHNRIIGSSQSIATTTPNIKNVSKAETPTELHEITSNGIQQHHNNNNNNITARTNSQTPSPILGHHGKKIASSAAATLHEKKITTKLQASRKLFGGKHQQQQQQSHHQQQQQQKLSAEDTTIITTTTTATTPCAEYLDAAELQQLKFLNRHSCNGRLDYESLERHLQQTEVLQKQQDKSVEALGVLLQYLVHDLDAFGCPVAKSESTKLKDKLCKTQNLLDEVKEQICDKEAYYVNREEELQALHRCELEKVQLQSQEQLFAFETQLTAKDDENKRTFECYRLEMDNKFSQKLQQLAASEERERELKERLQAQEVAVKELKERLSSTEQDYVTRLKTADEHENALNERLKLLTQELETLRAAKMNSERELRDKLNLSHDEIAVLRTSHKSFNESMERSSMERNSMDRSGIGGNSPRNSSSSSSAASMELTRLQSEVESLRYVLEMKQKEISKLAKHNEELVRDADERVALQGKISVLESSKEMLQSELNIKTEKEKDYQLKIDNFQKAYTHEAQKCTKLTYNIEALQWQLKQRSEQLHIVQAKMQEFSAQDSSALNITINQQNTSSLSSLNRSSMNGASGGGGGGCANNSSLQMEDISPPTSPVIKGVIEKPDSVSWVLEMDDETPEVAASKMVKRAGSFRSVERSPTTRRQLSVSATMTNGNTSANAVGPNPLSQSMSATSVIRQHSSDAVPEFTNRSHARIRSKSVSVKSSDPNAPTATSSHIHSHSSASSVSKSAGRKLARQHSVNATRKQRDQLAPITNKRDEPIATSSPYNHGMRPRTSTMCVDVTEDVNADGGGGDGCDDVVPPIEVPLFRRSSSSKSRKLITCDTSALNSGERLEMHSLPTHPSMHDIKMLKKCQQIQESAGEAMVSGTNSEDEACSASSDEIVSSVSTSSATSGSTSSLHHSSKNTHMSLEEVLLLDKINSLNGTPMEVSWSDDAADVFTNGGGSHA